ncbi:MAG: hypothetical protein FE78DRAFT_88480 [Acidomyces sp. 'richmondensis']|nr:MAG: hypothetical protein FE78DRAFT_88480 [Acidomyces sp. 'richmondensis']
MFQLIICIEDDEDIQSIVARAKEANENNSELASGADDVRPVMMQHVNTSTQLKFTRDSMEYKLTSIGHEVGLQTRFRPDSVKQYTITVRKPDNSSEKVRIKRAFKKHGTLDMMQNAVKLG